MKNQVFWLLIVLALAGLGVGCYFYFRPEPVTYPDPPEVKGDESEPKVAAFIQRYREEVVKNPASAEAWGNLGQAFRNNELDAESNICFAQAEKLDSNDPQWPYLLSGPLIDSGHWEESLPYLQRAVDILEANSDSRTTPRLMLAEVFLVLGRHDEAEAQIRRSLELEQNNIRAEFDLAALASSREDWRTAQTHLLRCLSNRYTQQKARIQLAQVSRKLGDFAKADEYQKEADQLSKDPHWPDRFQDPKQFAKKKRTRYKIVEEAEAAGNFKLAVEIVKPMLEDYPDDPIPYFILGKLLGQMGDFPGAETALRQALNLAPEKVQNHYYLALILFMGAEQQERKGADRARVEPLYRDAIAQANEALKIKPDYGIAHMVLGRAHRHLGERSEAKTELEKALHYNPEHGELHMYVGEILAEDGNIPDARTQFVQALSLAPPNAPWKKKLEDQLLEWKKAELEKTPKK
jgi:tetratricopeptide (TPR) repeat protein